MARVLAVVPDLMLASRVVESLRAVGHDVSMASAPDAGGEGSAPDLIVADLNDVDPQAVVDLGAPVIGFYSHVDTDTKAAAEQAGVDLVVPRSRMARELPELASRLLR